MPTVTKGSKTSSFPSTQPSITAQDESNDPASPDTSIAEAKDYNIAIAEIEAIAKTVGLGGKGVVTVDSSPT